MKRMDRKSERAVSSPEASAAWLETHELVECDRMSCRLLSSHCGTREECFRGRRCRKAPKEARIVQSQQKAMPMIYANPDC